MAAPAFWSAASMSGGSFGRELAPGARGMASRGQVASELSRLLSAFRAGEFRSYDEIVARTKF